MNTTAPTLSNAVVVPLVLVALCAAVIYVAVSGKPFSLTPTAAAVIVLVAGMAACMGGIGQVARAGQWISPVAILGYLLGAAILVYGAAAVFGFSLPLAAGKPQALVMMGALMGAKLIIGLAAYFFRWF